MGGRSSLAYRWWCWGLPTKWSMGVCSRAMAGLCGCVVAWLRGCVAVWRPWTGVANGGRAAAREGVEDHEDHEDRGGGEGEAGSG
jgi:hypothetical protein